jgi:hypothetical protein
VNRGIGATNLGAPPLPPRGAPRVGGAPLVGKAPLGGPPANGFDSVSLPVPGAMLTGAPLWL